MKLWILYRSFFTYGRGCRLDYRNCSGSLYRKSHDITISKIRYTFHTEEDILILGSSRAQHHYNPETLVKGTDLTAYNGGLGDQPAFSLVQLSETVSRYKPKAVILDVTPDFRYDHDSNPRLKILGPYFRADTLVGAFCLITDQSLRDSNFCHLFTHIMGCLQTLFLHLYMCPR